MMWDSNNVFKRADYSTFSLTDSQLYNLSIGGFSSDPSWRLRDSFSYHNGVPFSTINNSHDNVPGSNCAYVFYSPGWYFLINFFL